MIINLDFETRSAIDINLVGVHKYAEHPTTDVWCVCYYLDGDADVSSWTPGDPLPERLFEAVRKGAELHAWNAQFERTIWRAVLTARYGWPECKLEQWFCSMARAAQYGLPLSLAAAGKALGLPEQKDLAGRNLMLRMARPRGVNEDGAYVWWDDPYRLQHLIEYCKQDVRAERAIAMRLAPLSAREQRIWWLDQRINDRGILLDRPLAEAAREVAEVVTQRVNQRLVELTDGEVPAVTRVADLTMWLQERGVPAESVSRTALNDLEKLELPDNVREVLRLRREAGKSSIAKIDSMLAYAGSDNRLRGLLQYHGAATGRWSGRGPQPQNFPRGSVADPERFIPLILQRDVDTLDSFFPPLEVISSLLRGMLIASPNCRLLVADYSAIEARVLAWLADEGDLLRVFRTGGDPYKVLASKIYGVPISQVTKDQRLIGKMAVLGLGYQMGASRFIDFGKMNGIEIHPDFAKEVVRSYREAHASIVRLWSELDAAVVEAVRTGRDVSAANGRVRCRYEDRWLAIRLPSGRNLWYRDPTVAQRETPWGAVKDSIRYWGVMSGNHQWQEIFLYGGLLTENIVQAIARDLLADAMCRIEARGYRVLLTVHDEIVAEREIGEGSLEEFEELMAWVPDWAEGCPVTVEGWEGPRYRK